MSLMNWWRMPPFRRVISALERLPGVGSARFGRGIWRVPVLGVIRLFSSFILVLALVSFLSLALLLRGWGGREIPPTPSEECHANCQWASNCPSSVLQV